MTPSVLCLGALEWKLQGRLEPGVLGLPSLTEYLGLDGCNSQLSPGWLTLAQPFFPSLSSPHIWNWVGTSGWRETAVRDAQFVVETLKLSWRPCVMGRRGAGPGSGQIPPVSPTLYVLKEGKATPGCVSTCPLGLAWWAEVTVK